VLGWLYIGAYQLNLRYLRSIEFTINNQLNKYHRVSRSFTQSNTVKIHQICAINAPFQFTNNEQLN